MPLVTILGTTLRLPIQSFRSGYGVNSAKINKLTNAGETKCLKIDKFILQQKDTKSD